ncbi:glycosyltransferase [Salinisphaera sp. USBA-960]|nr:glycosyltransferase [Salifodinibacter halophilus]NNC27007.1 glycosyltransferase [Salifodinibacter halophilus]
MRSGTEPRRLAIFVSFSGQGGVEHMLVNLLDGLVAEGVAVDLLLARTEGPFVASIPDSVNQIRLRARHTAWCVPELALYLARNRPPALLAVKDRAIRAALRARWLARVDTRLVGRLGTNLGASLAGKSAAAAALRRLPMRRVYRHVDGLIAVSDGVAADSHRVTGLPAERIETVRNPVVTATLFERASEPCPHPWPGDGGSPVIVGIGRLTEQKGWTTLLDAFAELRRTRDCRLLIVGEGPERAAITRRIESLALADCVALAGFVENPAAILARADMFVLSSRWEGSPNALTEALAIGTPVVATDCPSGPREILADGRFGPLVPVDAVSPLAEAMRETLAHPLPAEFLQQAVAGYDTATATRRYLEVVDPGRM